MLSKNLKQTRKADRDRNLRQARTTPPPRNGSRGVTHRSRDHSIPHMPYPIGAPL